MISYSSIVFFLQVPTAGTNQISSFTIIFIVFLILIFFTWFFIHRSKEKERLLLIEKNVDLSELENNKTFNFNFPWLRFGCVITLASVGLLCGILLSNTLPLEGIEPLLGLLIFGGIGMIIAHYLDRENSDF